MSEQPPELLEQVGTGPNGATWKARQADGREVLAFQTILTDEAARQAALDRLRRLARIPSHRLTPIRGWWADGEGIWVVSDLEQGVGMPDLPGGGFLSPQQAAAISFGILEGLDALHAEGLNHGDLAAENVRVMPDGNVRLAGHQLATLHFPSQEELVAELRDAGRLVCQAFGVTPARDSRAAPRAIEHAAPALVVTARAIAGGTMRSDVKAALTALRETSGPLGGHERLALGAGELAALVATKRGGASGSQVSYRNLNAPIGSGSMAVLRGNEPASPPPPRPAPAPPAEAPRPAYAAPAAAAVPRTPSAPTAAAEPRRSWEERTLRPLQVDYREERRGGPNWLLIGGIIAVVVVLALGGWFVRGLLVGSGGGTAGTGGQPHASPSGGTSASPKSSPSAAATATPGQVPVFAPAAAGNVKGVALKADSAACAAGGACTFNVVITFNPTGSSHDVTWTFKTFDLCTSKTTDFAGGLITADGTWNTTDGNTTLTLPAAKGQLAVVALSGPDVAASTPLKLGTAGC
jgi:Protein kinase domain